MKRMNKTKTILVLAAIVLVLTCTVSGTVAFLVTKTDPVENQFTPAKVTCAVDEDFTNGGTTKRNVRIENTGNTDAWIRATVVANWVKDNKIVAPWTDNVTYNTGEGKNQWTKSGNYFYYNDIVSAGGFTEKLISSYTPGNPPVEGAHLEMTIVCQAVQANIGTTAQAAFKNAATNPSASGQ